MSDLHCADHIGATCPFLQRSVCKLWHVLLVMIFTGSQIACSDPLFEGEIARVKGVVTYNGTPLTDGRVTFHQTEKGTVIGGTLDDKGQYTLTFAAGLDVPAGSYQVTVRPREIEIPIASEAPAGVKQPKQTDAPQSKIPKKYLYIKTSDLTAEVAAGENQIDFELVD